MATAYTNLTTSGTGTIGDDKNSILAAQTLPIIENATRFYQCGQKLTLAGGTAKIWKAIRYLKVTLPVTALSEGVTPDGSSMTTEEVTGTAEQWGAYISLSDVGILTLAHPVMQKANELLGENAAELMDREIQVVLEGATNIQYGAGVSGRAILSGTGILNTSVVARMVATLRNNGAKPQDGDNYLGILDPSVEMDIILEAKFLNASQYSNLTPLYKGEIGKWMGVRWLRSNFVRTYYGAGLQVAATGSYDSGVIISGVGHSFCCVGYDPTYRLKMSISDWVTGEMPATGYSMAVTTPDDPSGYLWDAYCGSGTGSTPLLCAGQSATGRTGGSTVEVVSAGSGASAPVSPVTGETLHNVWIFGRGGFGVTEVTGLQRTLTPAGASDSDVLAQRRKTGYKLFFKTVILEDDFMGKIEVQSAHDSDT